MGTGAFRKKILVLPSFAVAMTLAVSVVIIGPANAGSPPDASGFTCTPKTITDTYGRDASGARVSLGAAGSASVQVFSDGSMAVNPPAGVIPNTLTRGQRQNLGFSPDAGPNDNVPNQSPVLDPNTPALRECKGLRFTPYVQGTLPDPDGRGIRPLSGQYFYNMLESYTVPSYAYYCLHASDSSAWIGFQEPSEGSLLQAGTMTDSGMPTGVSAFFEEANEWDANEDVGITIHQGDAIQVQLIINSTTRVMTSYWINSTWNTSTSSPWTFDAGDWTTSSYAVWMTERPTVNGSTELLRQHSQYYFSNQTLQGWLGDSHWLNNTKLDIHMQAPYSSDPTKNHLEDNVLGHSTQSETWKDCGPGSGTNQ